MDVFDRNNTLNVLYNEIVEVLCACRFMITLKKKKLFIKTNGKTHYYNDVICLKNDYYYYYYSQPMSCNSVTYMSVHIIINIQYKILNVIKKRRKNNYLIAIMVDTAWYI